MRMSIKTLLVTAASCLAASAVADEPVPLQRLTPPEIAALVAPVTTGRPGVQMTNLIGDPTKAGLYTVRVSIPPNTKVPPHTHRDNRSVTVISGTWHMGYGSRFDPAALKDLPAGSFYTEPAGQAHFAQTLEDPVVIWVTGYGPSDTKLIAAP